MSLEITPSHIELLPELSRFLAASAEADLPARFLEPSFLEWKFFTPRPDWSGPRSLVAIDKGAIIAHVGLWPGVLLLQGAPSAYVHPTDWFANPSYPGSGFMLMRHVVRSAGCSIVVGGSADSQALLPRLGFHVGGAVEVRARPVRPWKRGRSPQRSWSLKGAARLVRDTAWSLDRLPRKPQGWSLGTVDTRLSELDDLYGQMRATAVHRLRSRESLLYLLRCPHVNGRLASILREGRICGYLMLNSIGGECRIVDLYVHSDQPDDWRAAYTLAVLAAIDDENTCEVVAATSLAWIGVILAECGLRLRREKRVLVADGDDRSLRGAPLALQLSDSDSFCYRES